MHHPPASLIRFGSSHMNFPSDTSTFPRHNRCGALCWPAAGVPRVHGDVHVLAARDLVFFSCCNGTKMWEKNLRNFWEERDFEMLSISLNQIRFILVKLILTSKMKLYTRTWVIQQTLSFTADEMEKKAPPEWQSHHTSSHQEAEKAILRGTILISAYSIKQHHSASQSSYNSSIGHLWANRS